MCAEKQKIHGLNFVAPSGSAEKNLTMHSQLQIIVYINPQKLFKNTA